MKKTIKLQGVYIQHLMDFSDTASDSYLELYRHLRITRIRKKMLQIMIYYFFNSCIIMISSYFAACGCGILELKLGAIFFFILFEFVVVFYYLIFFSKSFCRKIHKELYKEKELEFEKLLGSS